jgi:protein-disulfide isomerase
MKRYLPFVIIILVLAIGIGVFAILWKRNSTGNANSAFANSNIQAPPSNGNATPVSASSPDSSAGLKKPNVKVSSPVVIEEYGDYQCPPCGQLYPELKQIEEEYGNQVQIVFHHFPLMKMHKNALAAAHAAEAARNQNKFWEMHDHLYRNQKEWSELEDPRAVFLSYAQQLKLNLDRFKQDMESNLVDQRISADIQRGQNLGVTGTPTVFLDTHMLRYEATNADGLRRGINVLLERKAVS